MRKTEAVQRGVTCATGVGVLLMLSTLHAPLARASDLNAYRATYREVNGMETPTPIVGGWTYCDENAGRAEELARKYIGSYWQSVVRQYELIGDNLTKMKG